MSLLIQKLEKPQLLTPPRLPGEGLARGTDGLSGSPTGDSSTKTGAPLPAAELELNLLEQLGCRLLDDHRCRHQLPTVSWPVKVQCCALAGIVIIMSLLSMAMEQVESLGDAGAVLARGAVGESMSVA